MKLAYRSGPVVLVSLLAALAAPVSADAPADGTDPWQALQSRFAGRAPVEPLAHPSTRVDPWKRLHAVFLPFSAEMERQARGSAPAAARLAERMKQALDPFRQHIRKAADTFDVPAEIIAAVILVESGADPDARSASSTAAGLMQTIAGTFDEARADLKARRISIADNPLDPHASIMAGSWYLAQMFARAGAEHPAEVGARSRAASWRRPLEYYYAGPHHGGKRAEIVMIYAGGRRVRVNKPAYSRKVLQWAAILAKG